MSNARKATIDHRESSISSHGIQRNTTQIRSGRVSRIRRTTLPNCHPSIQLKRFSNKNINTPTVIHVKLGIPRYQPASGNNKSNDHNERLQKAASISSIFHVPNQSMKHNTDQSSINRMNNKIESANSFPNDFDNASFEQASEMNGFNKNIQKLNNASSSMSINNDTSQNSRSKKSTNENQPLSKKIHSYSFDDKIKKKKRKLNPYWRDPLNAYHKNTKRQKKRGIGFCRPCSFPCLCLTALAGLLLAIGLCALLIGLLQPKSTTTTTTTSTTTSVTTTTATTTTSTTTTTTAAPIDSAFWPFNSNTLELYNGLDGNASGSPTYTTSLFGYGAAINLQQSSSQFVSITSKPLPLDSRSFTIEAWIYAINLTNDDYGIFGQCQTRSANLCFHFIIRNQTLFCSFFASDLSGVTPLSMNIWTHVAFVYDAVTQIQRVWLNGVLDGTRSASPYQGLWGTTTIGATFHLQNASYFNGFIDQVRFESRAKNVTEILNDATLCVYHSFDGGSLLDNGINGINATAFGNLTITTGRVNQAVEFYSGFYISYAYRSFYFLGVTNYSFSIALWAYPKNNSMESALVFLYSGTGGWCLHLLGMGANGQLNASIWNGAMYSTPGPILSLNTWTHIGYTYSSNNGMRLYINGSQFSTTGATSFAAAGSPMKITLGDDHGRRVCTPGYGGQFIGALDEFYVYSRELTSAEVWTLANP